MELTNQQLNNLIRAMRAAFAEGRNAMQQARDMLSAEQGSSKNHVLATLIAYDLQAGSYVEGARRDPEAKQRWCQQLADLIDPVLPLGGSLLEVGVGEATTMGGGNKRIKK
jgi:hypothetical protein